MVVYVDVDVHVDVDVDVDEPESTNHLSHDGPDSCSEDLRPQTSDLRLPRTLAVNIDLDDLRYYRGIHALPPAPDTPEIFQTAVPRFLDLCDRVGVRATLFTIGRDVAWREAASELRRAVDAGHEVASHSLEHQYDLSRRPAAEIDADLGRTRSVLQDATGVDVVGFRAPGYNVTPALLAALARTGHRYDSSVLPSPPYWMARAAVIASLALRGRRSASIVGRARDFFRRRRAFTWGGAAAGLREFPMTSCGALRLPLIGTFLRPWRLRDSLVHAATSLPFVNVEFHALDFLGIAEDRLEPALEVEPALRVPLADRLASFEDALRTLARARRPERLRDLGTSDA